MRRWDAPIKQEVKQVSIHASVKDATIPNNTPLAYLCFNPRICKRCDYIDVLRGDVKEVSIHASVKDAT